MRVKLAWILVLFGAGALLLAEFGLRWLFGFGRPLLYAADSEVGYRLAPNQRTRRFGNRIEINQYSMRGMSIDPQPKPGTLRVLLLGDSIANGGWWTDGEATISALLQRRLAETGQTVEVLNASANSWGPRNEWAYVRKFGTFGSQAVVLLINTDDLFARKPTSVVVGRDRNYPDRLPPFAIVEVVSRYILPAPDIPELKELEKEGGDIVGRNLESIEQLHDRLQADSISLLLAMTPLKRELPQPRDYEIEARQRLSDFAEEREIPYINFLPLFNSIDEPETLYRDHIHLSPLGNEQVVREIDRVFRSLTLP
ncbi:MAG: SGNH/GDSL hydrolase family protein [Cyanobacteria bacterium SID2]|nr:SGNH/GDSL hydrolase family protein [Cyanobacteria bacterium SID2]MBP0002539.1 SGNH/GDSL hydrolase family protein [Cyanobacteria bacterium SBC]